MSQGPPLRDMLDGLQAASAHGMRLWGTPTLIAWFERPRQSVAPSAKCNRPIGAYIISRQGVFVLLPSLSPGVAKC